jgi:hypothetical protein
MKRKITKGIVTLALIAGACIPSIAQKEPRQSPADVVTYKSKDLEMTIKYGRPFKKNRVIFGSEPTALLPYGKYWRLGANEATLIQISHNVIFNGKELKAGNYSMYAYPGKDTWTIYINSDVKHWGAQEPDHNLDVLKTDVRTSMRADVTEEFTISFDPTDANGHTAINFIWDKTAVKVPVTPK